MEILNDQALVLNRSYYNDSNILVTLFTKKYGKIMCLCYGIRKSKKKEVYSLNPTTYISVQIYKKLNDVTLKEHTQLKDFSKLHENLYKLEISLYIVYVLDKILEYNHSEKQLYDVIENIYTFLIEVDNDKLNKEYILKFISRFLKRVIIELGIYSETLDIKSINTEEKVKKYEKYICSYFNIEMDYKKIIKVI